MNNFEVFNETEYDIDLEEIKNLLNYALKYKKIENTEFNIIFVDSETIREINRDYRGIDRETDVISFALEDDNSFPMGDVRVLGDIYISVPKMKAQAIEYKTGEKRECAFLVIHGLLHLLGYDHMTEEEEKIMFGEQEAILNGYGIKRWIKKKRNKKTC